MPTTPPNARRATMKDVAALAGVGLSTVSRVVAGKPGVSAARRAAVEAAIAQLDFRPNEFARTLRTGSAETIGVVVTRISDPFYSTLVSAVEHAAQRRDLLVLIASATDDPVEAERVVHRLLRRRLDGLIVVVPEESDMGFLAREIEDGLHVVFVDRPRRDVHTDQVVVDNEGGMAAAVGQLVAAGHTRIACVAHATGRYTANRRIAGYREGLRRNGLDVDERLISVVTDDPDGAEEELRRLAALADPPTAVIATNNRVTHALLEGFQVRGDRLTLVSFDDFEMAGLVVPPVTTVVQDPSAIGAAAATLLFDRIDGHAGPARKVVLETRLVDRGLAPLPVPN